MTRLDRPSGSRGGGLVTLLNKNKGIVCNPDKLSHLHVMNKNAEIQVFQLKPRNIKKMIILNCYRPPSGNIDSFLGHICNILDRIEKLDEFEVYICGDMNIDYSQRTSPGCKKLKNLETKYNLSQTISAPTRCTASCNSILDLIFTNSANILLTSPIKSNISDHEPVIAVRKSVRQILPRVNFTCRSYHSYSSEAFQADLDDYYWSLFYNSSDVDGMWDEMEKVILDVAIHCPYRTFTERVALAPWLSQDLLEMIKDRDHLYKFAKRSGTHTDWVNSRKARNKCNLGVKHAKEDYMKSQLVIHEKDPRKFWSALKSVYSPVNTSSSFISLTDATTGSLLKDDEVPEAFNTDLCEVGKRLSENFSYP